MKIRWNFFTIMLIILIFFSAIYFTISATMQIPPRKISSFTTADSYSYVRIKGVVTDTPSIKVEDDVVDSIYFKISDGSGTATIKIYAPLAEKIYKNKKIPSFGDYVDISGIIKVTDTSISITVYSENEISFREKTPKEIELSDVENYSEGSVVKVRGRVYEINAYSFGYIIPIVDISSGKMVNISIPYYYEIPDISNLSHSDITVVGGINYYGKYPEIIPRVFGGIYVEKIISYERVENITNLSQYSFVDVSGSVDYVISSDSYQLFILKVGNDRINVFVESGANASKVWYGENVRVLGIVSEYNGELEIRVRAFSSDFVEVIS